MATILYVDDEAAIRRVVQTWLARHGHIVHTAADLATARRILGDERLDGVCIDLWLGQESGLELLAELDDRRPRLAHNVVFVTGDIIPSPAVDHALEQLGHPILFKPFDLHELEQLVQRWAEASARHAS